MQVYAVWKKYLALYNVNIKIIKLVRRVDT